MKALLSILALFAVPSLAQKPASLYTDLAGNACKLVKEDKETGATVFRCPGVAGYALLVADDDNRMSIDVLTPASKQYPLNYWGVVTRGFSSLGGKAEWRVLTEGGRPKPIALIVRVRDDSEESKGRRSYLAVAKITEGGACVTHKIPSTLDANAQAREAADHATSAECLTE